MSDSSQTSKSSSPRGPVLFIVIALLLIGVSVGIVALIQAAPNASEGGGKGEPQGPPPAAVYVEAVTVDPAQNMSLVTGTLRATSRAEVAARESESVAEVLVDEGARVDEGEPLVRLSGDRMAAQMVEMQAKLRSAEKTVNQRTAELERAKTDLKMKEGLRNDRAISESDFLDAQSMATVMEAQSEAAAEMVNEMESQLDLMEIRQKDLVIKAPFAGVIAERHVEPGEWVTPGTSVMTLVTVDPVEAWMSVPERFLQDVNKNPEKIRVRVSSSGMVFEPDSVTIVPDVNRRSQLFTAVAKIANKDGLLAPGQSITGAVPIGKNEDHVIFSVDALLRSRLGDFVFKVDASSGGPMPAGKKVPVTVHFERDGMVYVKADGVDLKKGDQVITEGNDRLQPGQPLMVREEGEGALPAVKP